MKKFEPDYNHCGWRLNYEPCELVYLGKTLRATYTFDVKDVDQRILLIDNNNLFAVFFVISRYKKLQPYNKKLTFNMLKFEKAIQYEIYRLKRYGNRVNKR